MTTTNQSNPMLQTTKGLTLKSLADEIRPILNDLCLAAGRTEIVRLLGVREADGDLWYVVCDRAGTRTHASAVFACTSIRPGFDPQHYAALDGMFQAGGGWPVETMVIERDGAWLGTLRKVLSKLGLSAPESKETLAADLDAQMLRVQRAVENHFVAQAEASDEGHRPRPA